MEMRLDSRAIPIAALAAALACCDGSQPAARPRGSAAPRAALAAAGAAAPAAPAAEPAAPAELYLDLTRFDWYRRGEPLLAGGRAYLPAGNPVALEPGAVREAGRYGGVAYYVRAGAVALPDTLFVPVFEGYWQPFVVVAAPQHADD